MQLVLAVLLAGIAGADLATGASGDTRLDWVALLAALLLLLTAAVDRFWPASPPRNQA